jgi:hypothetical protein
VYREDRDLGTALRIPIAGGPYPYLYPLPDPLSDRDAVVSPAAPNRGYAAAADPTPQAEGCIGLISPT